MAYATLAKVREVLPKVTVAALSDAIVTSFIAKADAVCDSYIASRYSLPLASIPAMLEAVAVDLAAYFCMRTLYTRDNTNTNDWIESFRSSVTMLKDIRDGKLKLINTAGAEFALINGSTMLSNNQDYHPTFDMGDVNDSVIDTDMLTAIADAKE